METDEILQALRAAEAFWRAVGGDGDRVVEGLLTNRCQRIGHPGPGLAARLRDRIGATSSDCLRMAYVSPVDLLPGAQLRVLYVVADEFRRFTPDSPPLPGRRIELARVAGHWLIDPVGTYTLEPVRAISVPEPQDTPPLAN